MAIKFLEQKFLAGLANLRALSRSSGVFGSDPIPSSSEMLVLFFDRMIFAKTGLVIPELACKFASF